MRSFSKILVQRSDGQWSAWFQDVPRVTVVGDWPGDAVRQLIEQFGEAQFDAERIVAVDYATREDHREFLVPLKNHRRVPLAVTN